MGSVKPAIHGLERLLEGNERFRAEVAKTFGAVRAKEVLSTQKPFAVVLACSDARVVPELLFDQSLGRLFVVRVAGNVPGPEEIGSIEYAVDRLGSRLVLVLGHTRCGAVAASLDPSPDPVAFSAEVAASPNLRAITDRIRASFDPLQDLEGRTPEEAWRHAVEQNVRAVVEQIPAASAALARAADDGVRIVGAVYDVETGVVEPLLPDDES